jgi:asparagine N-glycosylation enzyme membrane subunit Stt3
MSTSRLSAAILVGIFAISISLMFWFLARHMPLRYFAWFCFLTGAYIAFGLALLKSFSEKFKENRPLEILLELVLAVVFVAAFSWFAAYVYPGTR